MHGMYWSGRYMPMMGRWYVMSNTSWWFKGGMLLLLILAVALVVLLAIHLARRNERPSEALTILQRRYVNGDIDKETYEQMKKDLR
ncbi:MAG: SHOCT domain-containing protein [Sphaerochaetaceae bacterium]|jgi:uncharacterized membrane protein